MKEIYKRFFMCKVSQCYLCRVHQYYNNIMSCYFNNVILSVDYIISAALIIWRFNYYYYFIFISRLNYYPYFICRINPEMALQDFSVSLLIDDSVDNILCYLHRGLLYEEMGR